MVRGAEAERRMPDLEGTGQTYQLVNPHCTETSSLPIFLGQEGVQGNTGVPVIVLEEMVEVLYE